MSGRPSALFLIHLVQDVNILRPLMFMAARNFGFDTVILVSTKLSARDVSGIWRHELDDIAAALGARLVYFHDDWSAFAYLKGHGILFTASESHLPNHLTSHSIFRYAPPSFLKVTLQHGFECVGFRHSDNHVRAHGATASFGADVVCSWSGVDQLPALAPSQRGKLLITGPASVLQMRPDKVECSPDAPGLVCENLHSVRLSSSGDAKTEFVDTFADFCSRLAKQQKRVALRPHPGGQYVVKNNVKLPPNAHIENAPIYRLDLRTFAYGISAPSSVLVDLLLAGIPTAVWKDRSGEVDCRSYEGLAMISSPSEWVEFARAAVEDRAAFLSLQRDFLEKQQMPLDPREVFSRFARLFRAAERMAEVDKANARLLPGAAEVTMNER